MEDNGDNILYQRQVNMATKTRTKLGRPPTRLQKHAPSCLQLGGNPSGNNAIAAGSSSLPVIPLLSPLVVSPQPLPLVEVTEESKSGNVEQGGAGDKGGPTAAGGWQHPAVPGYTDPSTLFTFFQSKCLLVNDA